MLSKSVDATETSGVAELHMLPDDIALITLARNNERAVTLDEKRLGSFEKLIDQVSQQRPRGLIIMSSNADVFCVGADVNIIRSVTDPKVGVALAERGQEIFNKIEQLPFPTIAAISGPCVGGGCEMVLACRYRIITDRKSSSIGLPEIKLGILPGFGGTQRLPRLVGLPRALDVILAGKVLKPKQALRAGLVNEVVSFEALQERAVAAIKKPGTLKPVKVPFADRLMTSTTFGRGIVRKKTQALLKKQTKGFYPAPLRALDVTLFGLGRGLELGLKREAEELGQLIVTPESKALVNIYFLTESAKALGKPGRNDVEHVHGVVIGAGVMGAGIAGTLARNDCSVILKDSSEESLKRGFEHIRKFVSESRSLSESEKSFVLNRVEATIGDSPNVGNANFAVEAIFEDLAAKKTILKDLSEKMPDDAVLASNTSSLSISEIAKDIKRPERIVGMHFFNPVEKMPLVEIVRGSKTSDKTVCVVAALTVKLGKFPIVVNDVPGFLVNRILTPYLNEAAFMLAEGHSIGAIDRAATAFGMPMGPLRLLDEVGLDVATHVSEIMVKGYGDRMKGPDFTKTLFEKGHKGKKSGSGFYTYGSGRDEPSGAVPGLLGITKSIESSAPEVLGERLILSLLNEAVKCLDEGVAGVPSKEAADQVDLGTVMGMGFPPFRGGLLYYADTIGAKEILRKLEALAKELGSRFEPVAGIRKRVEQGKNFHQAV